MLGFAAAIAVGTALLMLPIAKVGPGGANFVDALFTATSAVCVTGLIVVDTPVFWTAFGQVVILTLIKLGGLGIMIFASLIDEHQPGAGGLARTCRRRDRVHHADRVEQNPATLGGLDPWSRVLAGFFQSVQTRTAGFNSIDVAAMHDESWIGMDVLMFIGGGPAGTAGGIKVTTFAVLLFIMITELRGEGAVNIFGKRLSRAVHRQAITVVLMAVAAVIGGTILIMLISGENLDRSLFEAVSAFGTVGMSTGITGTLPDAAQLVLVALMFLGRLGPLTIGSAIALRDRRILYELPKERPAIG